LQVAGRQFLGRPLLAYGFGAVRYNASA
jgi:hypothetical protein